MMIFFVQFLCVFLPPLLNISCFCPLLSPSLHGMFPMVSLIFLKRSLVFAFYCFPLILCTDHWGRLSYLSLLFFGILHSNGYMFPFLICLFASLPFTAICNTCIQYVFLKTCICVCTCIYYMHIYDFNCIWSTHSISFFSLLFLINHISIYFCMFIN